MKLILHQASLNGNAQQQQWKITFKYIIGSKNLDKLANEPVNLIINQLILKREDYFNLGTSQSLKQGYLGFVHLPQRGRHPLEEVDF